MNLRKTDDDASNQMWSLLNVISSSITGNRRTERIEEGRKKKIRCKLQIFIFMYVCLFVSNKL